MCPLDDDVEFVLIVYRFVPPRGLHGALREQGSAALDNNRLRGDPTFRESALVNPDAARAFEVARHLAVNDQFARLDGIGQLNPRFFFDDDRSRTHLAA